MGSFFWIDDMTCCDEHVVVLRSSADAGPANARASAARHVAVPKCENPLTVLFILPTLDNLLILGIRSKWVREQGKTVGLDEFGRQPYHAG
jgi:hypothetical protein